MLLNWSNSQGLNALMNSAEFIAGFADKGSGEVDLVLSKGTGSATFTRATTATTVNSAGTIVSVASGTARSYYDPTTLQYRGYLAEGARTNLALRSQEFANATWIKAGTSTATDNTVASPDGTVNASTLTFDGTNGIRQAIAGTDLNCSVWAKQGTARFLQLFGLGGAASATNFDLQLGTKADIGGVTSSTITAYPDGWYRCSWYQAASSPGSVYVSAVTSLASARAVQNGTGTIFCFGFQAEANTFISTYIPTTTASVVRNADVLTYPFSGNASATVGSCYAELFTEWATADAFSSAVSFRAADGTLRVGAAEAATTITINDTVTSAQKTGLTSMATGSRKRASAWGSNKSATGDGASPATAGFGGDMGSVSIAIGCLTGGTNQWFGTIRNVRLYSSQLSASQLQAVTA